MLHKYLFPLFPLIKRSRFNYVKFGITINSNKLVAEVLVETLDNRSRGAITMTLQENWVFMRNRLNNCRQKLEFRNRKDILNLAKG